MKNTINIGIPSKGRLRKDVLKIFKRKKLKLISERGVIENPPSYIEFFKLNPKLK